MFDIGNSIFDGSLLNDMANRDNARHQQQGGIHRYYARVHVPVELHTWDACTLHLAMFQEFAAVMHACI